MDCVNCSVYIILSQYNLVTIVTKTICRHVKYMMRQIISFMSYMLHLLFSDSWQELL